MGDFFGGCLLIAIIISAAVGLILTANYYNLNTSTWECTKGFYTDAKPPRDKDYVCTQYGLKEQSK